MRVVPTRQIPCVFLGKMRLAFKVTNRSRTPYLFSTKTCVTETLPDSLCFLKQTRLRSTAPTFLIFFHRNAFRRNPAALLGFTFLVFSQVIRVLRSEVNVNLHVMRPTAPWFLIFFQGKCTSQEGFLGVVTAIADFHSYPSQEESQILTKEHGTGDVGLFDSQFLTNRGSLLWERA